MPLKGVGLSGRQGAPIGPAHVHAKASRRGAVDRGGARRRPVRRVPADTSEVARRGGEFAFAGIDVEIYAGVVAVGLPVCAARSRGAGADLEADAASHGA